MADIKEYQLFINGEWRTSTSGETIDIISPSTEEVVARVQNGTAEEALETLEHADKAQKEWKKLPARTRADYLYALADEIDANTEYLAKLLTKEQGKLLKVARFEVAVTASFIRYAAEGARRIEGDIIPSDNPNEQIWIQKVLGQLKVLAVMLRMKKYFHGTDVIFGTPLQKMGGLGKKKGQLF